MFLNLKPGTFFEASPNKSFTVIKLKAKMHKCDSVYGTKSSFSIHFSYLIIRQAQYVFLFIFYFIEFQICQQN